MVVYVDILLFINTVINFAVLETAQRLLKRSCRLYRLLIGSLTGALFSLMIFSCRDSRLMLLLLKLAASAVMTLTVFGWKSVAEYGKAVVGVTVVSLLFCGFFILFYEIFRPPNMLIVNDVVYFHVNPLALIGLTAVIYLLLLLIYRLLSERIKAGVVPLEFEIGGKSYRCIGKIDTGCNLKEPFSSSPVIVADSSVLTIDEASPVRIIPYSAVNASSYLKAVRADRVSINQKAVDRTIYIASADIHNHNYQAIINSEILR